MYEQTFRSYVNIWETQRTLIHIDHGYIWKIERYILEDLKNN